MAKTVIFFGFHQGGRPTAGTQYDRETSGVAHHWVYNFLDKILNPKHGGFIVLSNERYVKVFDVGPGLAREIIRCTNLNHADMDEARSAPSFSQTFNCFS